MGFVNCELKDKIAVITINRPEALNALNSAVLDELNAVIDGIDINVIRAVVLTGATRHASRMTNETYILV